MPKMSVTVPHTLGQAAAALRLGGFMEEVQKKYADQLKIVEQNFGQTGGTFAFKTMGMTINGRTEVRESEVLVECDLPFAAMMFKDKAEKAIRKNLTRSLEG